MILALLRHGEKSNPYSDHSETPLSPLGWQQAEMLKKQVEKGALPIPTHLIASELERTQATLEPLSHRYHLSINKKKEFDLQDAHETSSQFYHRVTKGLTFLTSFEPQAVVYVCSHQDWLHQALSIITSEQNLAPYNFWPTARYMIFEVPQGHLVNWTLLKEGRIL